MLTIELGYLYGVREKRLRPDLANSASGAIEASIFALLGLLLAFTFSAAQERMEYRRKLIMEETNLISTAYLRLDLLSEPTRAELRRIFQEYVDVRIAVYHSSNDLPKATQEAERARVLERQIWAGAIAALKGENPSLEVVVLPALNNMFDIATTRMAMIKAHTPATIFGLLFIVALLSAAVAGYGMAKSPGRNWFHRLAFVAIVSATVFVITDLEFPRRGWIRIDATDQLLIDLRKSMN